MPVSYTHLDVYKRQGQGGKALHSLLCLWQQRHQDTLKGNNTLPKIMCPAQKACPVSYTHLDVYKRQTYNSIQTLLTNRRYIGENRFKDIVMPDSIPVIIEKELFDSVQDKIAKNRRAPARHKADVYKRQG